MKNQFPKTPLFKVAPNYAPKKPAKMSALESFELTADETRELEGGFSLGGMLPQRRTVNYSQCTETSSYSETYNKMFVQGYAFQPGLTKSEKFTSGGVTYIKTYYVFSKTQSVKTSGTTFTSISDKCFCMTGVWTPPC
jgi:hypothetical protein